MSNPFELTYGRIPTIYIDRTSDGNEVYDAFNSVNPSKMAYIISGVRGSGKTAYLYNKMLQLSKNKNWITIDLNAEDNIEDYVF